eukprot:12918481-Prorocentrum_lima.AAC.1
MHVCPSNNNTSLLHGAVRGPTPKGKGTCNRFNIDKGAIWAGHVHMWILRILRADALCVKAHNTL